MRSRGFTLIELLVILTISAILVAMAVPMFTTMIHSNRVSSATNAFLAGLDLARSEAIRRGAVVTICRSANPAAVNPVCSDAAVGNFATDDWASGWIAFAKAPGNLVNAVVEPGDDVFVTQNAFQPGASPRVLLQSNVGPPQAMSFNSRGIRTGGAFGMTLVVDHRETSETTWTNQTRCVVVNVTGRPRVARTTAGMCNPG